MSYSVSIAKVLGISSAAFATGFITSFTAVSVPSLQGEDATVSARVWKRFFDIGKAAMPPLAIASSGCFTYLALKSRGLCAGAFRATPTMMYTAAAILLPTIVPYTILVMWDTNVKLEKKAAVSLDSPSDNETQDLLHKWASMNLNRAFITGSATLIAAAAALI